MKTVTLDVHSGESQMAVISPEGEIVIELQAETTPEELRRVVSGIPGPKRVVLENGPLSTSQDLRRSPGRASCAVTIDCGMARRPAARHDLGLNSRSFSAATACHCRDSSAAIACSVLQRKPWQKGRNRERFGVGSHVGIRARALGPRFGG